VNNLSRQQLETTAAVILRSRAWSWHKIATLLQRPEAEVKERVKAYREAEQIQRRWADEMREARAT
jgi:predicted transcriptional regulator